MPGAHHGGLHGTSGRRRRTTSARGEKNTGPTMFRPIRNTLGRSAVGRHLLTLFHGLSMAIGLASCWVMLGPPCLYWVAFISTVGVLVVHLMRISEEAQPGYGVGVLSGAVAMGWVGLLIALDFLGLVWVCVLIATTGPGLALWRRLLGRADPADGGPDPRRPVTTSAQSRVAEAGPDARGAVRDLPDLEVDALCLVWRRSYFQLLDAEPTSGRAAVVDYRQRILDEIDHRDPRGLSRWLASSPRASGNPLPYLHAATSARDEGAAGDSLPRPQGGHEDDGTP